MATSLLHSISIFLDAGMDDCINELYDISTAGLDDEMSVTKMEHPETESDSDLNDTDTKLPAKRNSRCLEVRCVHVRKRHARFVHCIQIGC